MLKTFYDPVVEEKGIEKGIEKGKEEGLKENIQYFLADLADYSEHKERLNDQLKLIKDFSKLKELLKASARVTSSPGGIGSTKNWTGIANRNGAGALS